MIHDPFAGRYGGEDNGRRFHAPHADDRHCFHCSRRLPSGVSSETCGCHDDVRRINAAIEANIERSKNESV